MTWHEVIAALAAYLLGSIPFGYLLFRLRSGRDIRTTGSGNIGATNVFRAAGSAAAAATFLLDAGKGYAAVLLANWIAADSSSAAAGAIVCALVGHCYPVFLKFRGGKGVATAMGAFLVISPPAVLIGSLLFAAVLAMRRVVSLASIIAVGAFPPVLAAQGGRSLPILLAALTAAGLIIARHRDNIRRLRTGTEPPIWNHKTDTAEKVSQPRDAES